MRQHLSKRIIFASAATLGFVALTTTGFISAQTYRPSMDRTYDGVTAADGGREMFRSCMEGTVRQREDDLLLAYEEYYRIHLALLQERSQSVVGVWSVADPSERNQAERDIEEGFRIARRESDDSLRQAEQEINEYYRQQERECKRQQQEQERQILDQQREMERLRRDQLRDSRQLEVERTPVVRRQGTEVRGYYDERRIPFSSSAPSYRLRYPTQAQPSGVTMNSAVSARVDNRLQTEQRAERFTNNPYIYDPTLGQWRLPSSAEVDRWATYGNSPFGPMPQGVCGEPWTSPGLGLAGDNLPLSACLW